MSVLARILQAKKSELAAGRQRHLPGAPPLRPIHLKRAEGQPLRILAEIKLKSPSAGDLSRQLTVKQRAAAYESAGASMVSVLCDHEFFGGSYEHLSEARQGCSLPILCKEFIIDELQLDWARAFGADAVLLIARYLNRETLEQLHEAALQRGLLPLVEIANLEDARWVVEMGCPVIGVNARDLDTLEMNSDRARTVLDSLPRERTRLHLSGLKNVVDVQAVIHSGVDAALIGEILMRSHDPRPLLTALVQAARQASLPQIR
jgi:indole-3-glycerol phosphate synthase